MRSWDESLELSAEAVEAKDLARAHSLAKQALLAAWEFGNPDGPEVGVSRLALGLILARLGETEEAREALSLGLEGLESFPDADPARVLQARRALAELLLEQQNASEAAGHFEVLLGEEERRFGPNHLTVARTLQDLAECHLALREELRAECLLRRCLAIRELALGSEHPACQVPRLHLAVLKVRQPDAALPELPDMAGLEPRAPVIQSLRRLAAHLVQRGALAQARRPLERAAELLQSQLDPEHPRCVDCMRDLGYVYLRLGEYARAEPPLRFAMRQAERVHGPCHPSVARLCRWLGESLAGRHRFDEALALFQRGMEVTARVHGPTHPSCAAFLRSMGALHSSQRNLRWAERFFRGALDALQASLGLGAAKTVEVVRDLASCLLLQGRGREARKLFENAVHLLRQQHGAEHPAIPAYVRACVALERRPVAA